MKLPSLSKLLPIVALFFLLSAAFAQKVPGILARGSSDVNPSAEFHAEGADYTATPNGAQGTCQLGTPGFPAPFPGLTWERLGRNLFVYYNEQPWCVVWGYFDWQIQGSTVTWANGDPGGFWTRL